MFVSTPVSVCEARDRKGLYAKARLGLVKHFTGIDDPYEVPIKPEVIISDKMSVAQAVQAIVDTLQTKGYILPQPATAQATSAAAAAAAASPTRM